MQCFVMRNAILVLWPHRLYKQLLLLTAGYGGCGYQLAAC